MKSFLKIRGWRLAHLFNARAPTFGPLYSHLPLHFAAIIPYFWGNGPG